MGYTTEFIGQVDVVPPLNESEVAYLNNLVRNAATPRGLPDQPESRCGWEVSADGSRIGWDGEEKFYRAAEWMAYLIEVFLRPGAALAHELASSPGRRSAASELERFTFDHVANGRIHATGEDAARWDLVVEDNRVCVFDLTAAAWDEPDWVE